MMDTNWKNYQEQVKQFFVSLGFKADIEVEKAGSRGKHNIDVYITFTQFGIDNKWIVECKYWKKAVPKEKVLAFQAITQDIGADKAFLLSESGFQAGAIACAQNTNIILSDLECLKNHAEDELSELIYSSKRKKLDEVLDLLRNMPWRQKYSASNQKGGLLCDVPKDYFGVLGRLLILEYALKDIKKNILPVVYDFGDDGEPKMTNDQTIFLDKLEDHIKTAFDYFHANKDFKPDST